MVNGRYFGHEESFILAFVLVGILLFTSVPKLEYTFNSGAYETVEAVVTGLDKTGVFDIVRFSYSYGSKDYNQEHEMFTDWLYTDGIARSGIFDILVNKQRPDVYMPIYLSFKPGIKGVLLFLVSLCVLNGVRVLVIDGRRYSNAG